MNMNFSSVKRLPWFCVHVQFCLLNWMSSRSSSTQFWQIRQQKHTWIETLRLMTKTKRFFQLFYKELYVNYCNSISYSCNLYGWFVICDVLTAPVRQLKNYMYLFHLTSLEAAAKSRINYHSTYMYTYTCRDIYLNGLSLNNIKI